MARVAIMVGMLLPLALGGCTSRSSGSYADLEAPRHALEGMVGRRCDYVSGPQVPASLDPVTRPGTRGAILLWARDVTPTDSVELSVRYGDEGRLSWVRVMETSMPADRAVELRRMLEGAMDERGPRDWGFRIQMVGGEVAILPSVVCRPEAVALVGRAAPPMGTAYEQAEAREALRRPIEVVVGLDELGRVTDVRIRLSSGSRLLDQYAADLARAYRYEPKLHDGLPIPSRLPLRLRTPRRF